MSSIWVSRTRMYGAFFTD